MKTRFTLYFLLFLTISFGQKKQTIWKTELDFGNGTSISTFLKVENTNQQYWITSPKNADIRMFGSFKARLARLLGRSPKKGIFVTIEGNKKNDSLFGQTNIPVFGKMNFRGMIKEKLLSGEFTKKDTLVVGSLTGVKSKINNIDYAYLYPKILKITHDTIYSKELLQTKKWRKFQKQLKKLCYNAHDDIELFIGFFSLSQQILPFSHYWMAIYEDEKIEEEYDRNKTKAVEPTVIFEELNKYTAFLTIKNFSTSRGELADILPDIVEKSYKNLIVDLRDNGGGGIDAAFAFARHIVNKRIEVGYFTTNKLEYSGFQPKLFKTLPEVQPMTTREFVADLIAGKGAKLIFRKPDNPVFSGNLYILTSSRTASTCEPIVYVLKKSKRATIIGEKTAGAMLSAAPFTISGKYKLYLPVTDFYTYDGVRLEGIGVSPNIETTSEEALDKALELITK